MLQIIKASAGSGKTYSLTGEYLAKLLGYRGSDGRMHLYQEKDYGRNRTKPHSRILAVTFTNKATAEMTARIVSRLHALACQDSGTRKPDHLDDLCSLYECSPQMIRDAAARALSDLLFNFSCFNVSTIDSFFQQVLRIFTRELDLPENFNLQIQENHAVAQAVGKIFSALNLPEETLTPLQNRHNRLVVQWLKAYMEMLVEKNADANILSRSSYVYKSLLSTIMVLRNETYRLHKDELAEYFAEDTSGKPNTRLDNFIAGLKATLGRRRAILARKAQEFLDTCAFADLIDARLAKKTLLKWSDNNFSDVYLPLADDPKSSFYNSLYDPEKSLFKKDRKRIPAQEDTSRLRAILFEGADYFLTQKFYSAIIHKIYLLGLFGRTCAQIEEDCRDDETFMLSDTTDFLHKVIVDEEVQFVYERLGQNLRHYLIDEFQDTSRMQWDCLSPLVRESLSAAHDNLIIGDEKQCIYRFRNSDPELLGHDVEDEIAGKAHLSGADRSRMIKVRGAALSENTNWRSAPAVVTFNNVIFGAIAREMDLVNPAARVGEVYSTTVQKVAAKNSSMPGYVELFFPPDSDISLRLMGREIRRQLASGYRPADICILVYTHAQGEAVISYLLSLMSSDQWEGEPVDIVSMDALGVSASPAVELIIGILRLATTPQYITVESNNGGAEQQINPAFRRNRLIHRYALSLVRKKNDGTEAQPGLNSASDALREAILSAEAAESSSADDDELQRELTRRLFESDALSCPSLSAITEKIIREFLPEDVRRSQSAFIAAFQDIVADYETRNLADIGTFLSWWDTEGARKSKLILPEGLPAISVMTIHQAKGLEFPCVHIPYCSKSIFPPPNLLKESWFRLDRDGFPGISPEDVPPIIPLIPTKDCQHIPMLRDTATSMRQQKLVDALNIAYVAFTRAVNELIAYAVPSKTGKEPQTIADYILRALDSLRSMSADGRGTTEIARHIAGATRCGDMTPDERAAFLRERTEEILPWLAEVGEHFPDVAIEVEVPPAPQESDQPASVCEMKVLRFGEPTFKATPPAPSEAQGNGGREPLMKFPDETLFYAGDPERPPSFDAEVPYDEIMKEYRVEPPRTLSISAKTASLGNFDIRYDRDLGIFLHDVLARVRYADELPLAMFREGARKHVGKPDQQKYLRLLRQALADKSVSRWFDRPTESPDEDGNTSTGVTGSFEIMNERPLTAGKGLRRPDRVMLFPPDGTHPDGYTVLLDYKFGAEPSKEEFARYRRQLIGYKRLLEECGYPSVLPYLFYPLRPDPSDRLIPIS